jgi:hypothetical protein
MFLTSHAAGSPGEAVFNGFSVSTGGTPPPGGTVYPAASSAGTYDVTVIYCDGSSTGRQATVSVDGGAAQTVSFTPTGSFTTVGAMTLPLSLAAGVNTIELANPAAYSPDINEIIVAGSP